MRYWGRLEALQRPENVFVGGGLHSETKWRGIFKRVYYRVNIKGVFTRHSERYMKG
jgi:hypothetical protein